MHISLQKKIMLLLPGAAAETVYSVGDFLPNLVQKESSEATKPRHDDLIRLTDETYSPSEYETGFRTFHQPTDGTQQDINDSPQGWRTDWRECADKAEVINAGHLGAEDNVKAVYAVGE